MLFTKASEYALLSLIFISKKDEPQDVECISNELEISRSFLAKILQNMARDGILNSFKGANGGFMLSRSPENITMLEVVESAERHEMSVFECSKSRDLCKKGEECKIWNIFNDIQMHVDEYLGGIKLSEVMSKRCGV
ncbi:MAG: Rrf2 family transcriptional regulator [Campylobacter sp.]|nr:Rrf2 family transcriptional regulator [Campylobacter sp.]